MKCCAHNVEVTYIIANKPIWYNRDISPMGNSGVPSVVHHN